MSSKLGPYTFSIYWENSSSFNRNQKCADIQAFFPPAFFFSWSKNSISKRKVIWKQPCRNCSQESFSRRLSLCMLFPTLILPRDQEDWSWEKDSHAFQWLGSPWSEDSEVGSCFHTSWRLGGGTPACCSCPASHTRDHSMRSEQGLCPTTPSAWLLGTGRSIAPYLFPLAILCLSFLNQSS